MLGWILPRYSIRDSQFAYKVVIFLVSIYEHLLYIAAKALTPLIRYLTRVRFQAHDIIVNPKACEAKPGDIFVHKDEFYALTTGYRTLGLGEAYMNGIWSSNDVEEFFYKVFSNDLQYDIETFPRFNKYIDYIKFGMFNLQTRKGSADVIENHYDPCNEIIETMLDKSMNYSCGYWKNARNLDQAQIDKMDLIARKLKLKPGMRVLDIGCGWGGLCKYFAEKYNVEMVGCTIAEEGAKTARKMCEGLKVKILVTDYREINEKFDRIVSVGMFEHVGPRNYRTFFQVADRCLKEDGILLLHTIGVNTKKMPIFDGWIHTYIFSNGSLPYPESICEASDDLFIIEDWQNMGHHYVATLKAWLTNFKTHWPLLQKKQKEPLKFFRMWFYYLSISAAAFRSRRMQLWQVVFSKKGIRGGYDAPR